MAQTVSSDSVTREILLGFVEQIEGIFATIDELGEDKRAVYSAAHDAGVEKTALGHVVAFRRRRGKNPAKFDQQDALVQKYLCLLDGTVGGMEPHARIRAREVSEQIASRTDFFVRIAQEKAEGYPRRGERSVVYFLHAPDAGTIKIGVSHDLDRRIGSLTRTSPLPLELLLTVPGDHKVEAAMHERFADLRLHGEWFSTTDGTILEFIRNYVPDHDPETGEITEADHGDASEQATAFARGPSLARPSDELRTVGDDSGEPEALNNSPETANEIAPSVNSATTSLGRVEGDADGQPIPTPAGGGNTTEPDSGLGHTSGPEVRANSPQGVRPGKSEAEQSASAPAKRHELTEAAGNPNCQKLKRGEDCMFSHQGFSCAECNFIWATERQKARKRVPA